MIIAGPQCIVTTSPCRLAGGSSAAHRRRSSRSDEQRPFLFDVGDGVSFRRIDRASLRRAKRRATLTMSRAVFIVTKWARCDDPGRRPPRLDAFWRSESGPMDRGPLRLANLALGNDAAAPAIEISMGGLQLECVEGEVTLRLRAADSRSRSTSRRSAPGLSRRSVPARGWPSSRGRGEAGRIWLLPGTCTPNAGSTARRRMARPDSEEAASSAAISGLSSRTRGSRRTVWRHPMSGVRAAAHLRAGRPRPAGSLFRARHYRRAALAAIFSLTDAYDRMGVRLAGPSLRPVGTLDMPSEAIVRGSIQVAGDGRHRAVRRPSDDRRLS